MKLVRKNKEYKEGSSIRFEYGDKYDKKYGDGRIKKIEFNKQNPGESIITVEAGFKWKERFDSKPSNIIKIKANQILTGDNFQGKVKIKESNRTMKNLKLFGEFVNEANLGDELWPENSATPDDKKITKILTQYKDKILSKYKDYLEPKDFQNALTEYIMDFDGGGIKTKADLKRDFIDYMSASGYIN